jgi:hypothetical protein
MLDDITLESTLDGESILEVDNATPMREYP